MFFRDAESYNRSILREEKQGGRKDEIKKNNGTITCRMHGGMQLVEAAKGKRMQKRVETDR